MIRLSIIRLEVLYGLTCCKICFKLRIKTYKMTVRLWNRYDQAARTRERQDGGCCGRS